MQTKQRQKPKPEIEFDTVEFAEVKALVPEDAEDKPKQELAEKTLERIRVLVKEFKPLVEKDPEFLAGMQIALEDAGFDQEVIDAIHAELEEHLVDTSELSPVYRTGLVMIDHQ